MSGADQHGGKIVPAPHSGALTVARIMPWVAQGKADPVTRYLFTLSQGSRAAQLSALRIVARTLTSHDADPRAMPWHALSPSIAAALGAKLRERYSWQTVNRMLAAVRGVYRICLDETWIAVPSSACDTDGRSISKRDWFEATVRGFRGPRSRRAATATGRALTDAEIAALFRSCDADKAVLDAAVLALGIGAGLRIAEIAALEPGDIGKTGEVLIRAGKGGKQRVAFLPPKAFERLQSSMPPFPGRSLAGRIKQIRRLLADRIETAGVTSFTPHDMRRTFVTRQLRAGTAIGSVQTAAGHESIETTRLYDRTGIEEIRTQVQKVDLPPEGI